MKAEELWSYLLDWPVSQGHNADSYEFPRVEVRSVCQEHILEKEQLELVDN